MRVFLLFVAMMTTIETHAQLTFNCTPNKTDKEIQSLIISLKSQFEGIATIVKNDRSMDFLPFHVEDSEVSPKNYISTKINFNLEDKYINFEQDDFELNGIYLSRKILFKCYSRGQLDL